MEDGTGVMIPAPNGENYPHRSAQEGPTLVGLGFLYHKQ